MRQVAVISVAAVLSALCVQVMDTYGGILEGRMQPVAVATKLYISTKDVHTVVLSGAMRKQRNCAFLAMEAVVTEKYSDLRVRVPLDVQGSTRLLPVGATSWGPWTANIPAWQANAEMVVYTYHQCHPLWVTKSVFMSSTIPPASERVVVGSQEG